MPLNAFAGAQLTIDLDAIAANWRSLGARLKKGSQVAGVVKANAFGLGLEAVAPVLYAAGCREFFSASLDEGIALRAILPESRIYVFSGPLPEEAEEFSRQRLIPVLNDLGQIDTWRAQCSAGNDSKDSESAVLHVDTGMSRLGLPADEVARLVAEPERLHSLNITYVMSHLACAEERDQAMNGAQLAEFKAALKSLNTDGMPAKASFANSSGIFLGPDYHFDLVRPGAALYGLNPTPDQPNPMAEVVRLEGKIRQVRHVDTGRSVGYGAAHVVTWPSRIATVPVGYADGYLRSAGNQASAYIRGVRAPIIGRVSMDMITLDVTEIPAEFTQPGAPVDLIGGPYPVDAFAADADTIGYEMLTSLGQRYRRCYIENGKERAAF